MHKRLIIWIVSLVFTILFLSYGVDRVTYKYFTPYSFELFYVSVLFAFISVYKVYIQRSFTWDIKHILLLGIGIRIIIFAAEPNLSDDYYRFIWDGTLIENGINPFVFLPSEVIQWPNSTELGFTKELYSGFNSQNYYSVYPPVNQFIFFLSAYFGNGHIFTSILIIRFCILIAEIGSIYFLCKLLIQQNIPIKHALWYVINPLILLEFTVNLHFESIMICFMLGALYYLSNKKLVRSGLFWALAICTKLIPIIYLAFLLKRFTPKQWIIVGTTAVLGTLLLFIPFWNSVILGNIQDSIDKYFGYFEFNAGIPYIIRYIGYQFYDYSILFKVMPLVKKLFIGFVVLYSLSSLVLKKTKPIFTPIYVTAFIYFLFAGILHPWYITILVPLGLLSKNYTGIVWSFLIFLSYSAYKSETYMENMWLIGIEFSLLFLVLLIENSKWLQRKLKINEHILFKNI